MPDQKEVGEGILQSFLNKATGEKQGKKRGGLLGAGAHALKIPGFKHGGKVKKTGIYKLHKGEKVLTAKQAKSHPCLDC